MNIKSFIYLFVFASVLFDSHDSMATEDKSAVQPAFAQMVNSKELPSDAEGKIKTQYENGKSSYKSNAKLISKITNKKVVKIDVGSETYFLMAFPELVHLVEGFGEGGVDAQSSCDVIQYRKNDGVVSILPKEDIEGECITYYLSRPMVMDLDQDGNPDIVFFGNFKQPQVGGETTSAKVFLFDRNNRSFCFSTKSSEYIDADLKDPIKIFNGARAAAVRDSIKFTCD